MPKGRGRRSSRILIGLVVSIAAVGAAFALLKFSDQRRSDSESTPSVAQDGESQALAAEGKQVRDGDLEFFVDYVVCNRPYLTHSKVTPPVGTGYDPSLNGTAVFPAKGQYCLVATTVKNLGDKPHPFDDAHISNQRLLDTKGKEYPGAGAVYARTIVTDSNIARTFLFASPPGLKPGETSRTIIPFDLPTGAKPSKIQFRSTPLSQGKLMAVSETKKPEVQLTRPVKDDHLEFTAKSLQCGKPTAGADKHCVVELQVKPVADGVICRFCRFDPGMMLMLDSEGAFHQPQEAKYEGLPQSPEGLKPVHLTIRADPVYAFANTPPFTVRLAYTVPEGREPKRLALYASQASLGVLITP